MGRRSAAKNRESCKPPATHGSRIFEALEQFHSWIPPFKPGFFSALTPLAAATLVIIMVGATVLTLAGGQVALALIPLVVRLLSGFVAYS